MASGMHVDLDFQAIRLFLPVDSFRSTNNSQWNLTPSMLSLLLGRKRVENMWLGDVRERKDEKKVRLRMQVVRRNWTEWKGDSCHVERAGVSPWNGALAWKPRPNAFQRLILGVSGSILKKKLAEYEILRHRRRFHWNLLVRKNLVYLNASRDK